MPSQVRPYEDVNFTAADSPFTAAVASDLGVRAGDGYIACDGAGSIQVELSANGVDFDPPFLLKMGDVVTLKGLAVHTIRLTHLGTDSAYRILASPLGTDVS